MAESHFYTEYLGIGSQPSILDEDFEYFLPFPFRLNDSFKAVKESPLSLYVPP
jgi:hypothetical protein